MITTNTDGDPISQAFAAAMAESSVMYSMKLYRNGSDLGAVIKRAKLDLGAGQLSDDLGTFAACGVYQTQFSASLYDCPSILGDELEVRVGVLTGNAYEYVAVAYVTITEESVWKGVADVRGVGRMGLMHAPHGLAEGDYQPAAVASAIYAATGILVSIDARLTTQSVHADAGGTCRDVLESMCARLGAYACELGEGVSVMPYSSTATGTIPTGHVTGKPELGALYEVDGITVEAGEESFVQGTGRVHIVDGTATATTAAATWGNMRGYAFTPATLNIALIDPRWTVADTLSVTLGEDAYTIPARGISITYDGGYFGTISAAGLTAEAEEMTVEGPLTRSVGYARSVADEALAVAQATGQHFWHDDAGAHVSTEALNPTGASNSLWNSLGLLIRKAANNLVSITQSAVAFYDGNGNAASNITAQFGSAGATIGKTDGAHMVQTSTKSKWYAPDGTTEIAEIGLYNNDSPMLWLGDDERTIRAMYQSEGQPNQADIIEIQNYAGNNSHHAEVSLRANGTDGQAILAVTDGAATGTFCVTPQKVYALGSDVKIQADSSGGGNLVVSNIFDSTKGNITASGSVTAASLNLTNPLTVDNGGTGADNAADARANLLAVGYTSGMNAHVASFLGANQMWGLRAKVVNANNTAYLDHTTYIMLRNNGVSCYDATDTTYPWQLTLPSSLDLTVNVGDVSITNATATTFETRRQGSVVNLQVYQLKVAASLADGASVSLGSGIIGANARPSTYVYMPLMANVSGKGSGCFLYVTPAGNVTLYNRSGSALGTGTNLAGNTTWVI